jgi:hypothetical protein
MRQGKTHRVTGGTVSVRTYTQTISETIYADGILNTAYLYCISVRLVGTAAGRSVSHEIAEATCRYWHRVPLATSVALLTHSFPTYHLHIYNTYLHGTGY